MFDFDHGQIGQSIIFSLLPSLDSLRSNKQLVCSRPISSALIVLSIVPFRPSTMPSFLSRFRSNSDEGKKGRSEASTPPQRPKISVLHHTGSHTTGHNHCSPPDASPSSPAGDTTLVVARHHHGQAPDLKGATKTSHTHHPSHAAAIQAAQSLNRIVHSGDPLHHHNGPHGSSNHTSSTSVPPVVAKKADSKKSGPPPKDWVHMQCVHFEHHS